MRLLYLITVLSIVLPCKGQFIQPIITLKIDPEQSDLIGLSQIASDVDKVILETAESCLITRVQEIETTNQYIFINDAGKRVLQFNSLGKFIKQIGSQGRGPGEYTSVYNIAVDSKNSILYFATYRKIMCFDFSGELVNEIEQESLSESIAIVGDKLWTVSTSFVRKQEEKLNLNTTRLIIYSLQGNPIDTIIVKNVTTSVATLFPQAHYISDLGNIQYLYYPVLFYEPIMRDTLYQVKENELIPSVKLDFGKANEPRNGKKPVFIRNIFRTSEYLFAEYSYKSDPRIFCYGFSNDYTEYYNVNEGFTDDYFNTGVIQLIPLNLKDGIMVFVKEAFDLVGKLEGVSENSNPVIFIVKLKK